MVTAFVQVHVKNAQDRAAALALRARIVDDAGRAALDAPIDLSGVTFDEAGVADVPIAVPSGALSQGRYLLTVEATLGHRAQRRDVPFEIR